MNITVTHTIHPDVIALLQTFAASVGGQTPVPVKSSKKIDSGSAPAAETGTSTSSAPAASVQGITLEQVRQLAQQKNQAGKREQIKEALAEFKADKVTSLKQDQYEAFYKKIEAL